MEGQADSEKVGTSLSLSLARKEKDLSIANFVILISLLTIGGKMMHCHSAGHQSRLVDFQSSHSITDHFRGETQASIHSCKVMSAELMMAKFIALHNLLFQMADHFTDLVSSMFPDSRIAADFSCKHTKTKAIICDAINPHFTKPIIEKLRCNYV